MAIFLNILFLVLGFVFLIKGADFLVSGASAVAKKLKISGLVIGLTVVAIGTSLPELAVSVSSAIKGETSMVMGNIIGSNMFNMCVCLGIVAMLSPIVIKKSTKCIDFVFLTALTGLLLIFSLDKYLDGAGTNMISRIESIVLILVLALYFVITVVFAKKEAKINAKKEIAKRLSQIKSDVQASLTKTDKKVEKVEKAADANSVVAKGAKTEEKAKPAAEKKEPKDLKIWQIILYIVIGLAGVIFGGECVSSTSQFLALKMGMSEMLVGLTIVAIGTSLPELVTTIVALKKGEKEMAIGDALGSNIVNIGMVIGLVGVIAQINTSIYIIIDLAILLGTTILFVVLSMIKNKLSGIDGAILVFTYTAYLVFEIVRNYCF